MAEPLKFPAGFLWGTASAAHQVEGANFNNDWWEWEQTPGHIQGGDTSLVACDHYRRFREDFRLLRDLDNNAHRFSIEWSRVEPRPGEFDRREIDHYRDVLTELHALGLSPMLTLHHYSSPLWFTRRGGWESREAPAAFARFVRRIAAELGELVDLWCTINEINIYGAQGWIIGEFPPGHHGDLLGWYRVSSHLREGHELAYRAIHEALPEARVGLAFHFFPFQPASTRRRDRLAAFVAASVAERWPQGWRYPRVVGASSDWIGVQHYHGQLAAFDLARPADQFVRRTNVPGKLVTDMGWSTDPEWMYDVLVGVRDLGKPVYITESGIATRDDAVRQRYLLDVLRAAHRALGEGVDLRGYFHWTSMDNFEWARGYSQQFGLIGVDRDTLVRTVKPSGRLFARIAAANALPVD